MDTGAGFRRSNFAPFTRSKVLLQLVLNCSRVRASLRKGRPPVYICLCHGFTDTQVKRAVAEGRRSMRDVYAALGGKPRCGKCVSEVRALVAPAPPGGSAATGTSVPAALRAPQTE